MEVVSVATAKIIDKCAINEFQIPSIVLMEAAAHEIFTNIKHMRGNFHIFCGEGNNGGDGLAVARKLLADNKNVKIYIVGSGLKRTEEFTANFNIIQKLTNDIIFIKEQKDIKSEIFELIKDDDIILDCIFGAGLNRTINDFRYEVIDKINNCNGKIISVDIPSGLNGDTGQPEGISIKAYMTLTIENYKKGFLKKDADRYLGIIRVVGIGIPNIVKKLHNDGIYVLDKKEYRNKLPVRSAYGHKGNYGRILVLAGSLGLTGAAYLSSMSAVATGSGLVTLLVPDTIQEILSNKLVEVMTVNYKEENKIKKLIKNADVIACGPGLSQSQESINMLERCIVDSKCSIVLDADAINILSNKNYLFKYLENRCIITPHFGEFSRLAHINISDIEKNSIEYCSKYSKKKSIITVLKGHNTVISDGTSAVINRTGNSKMASGGMGDTLTGIIASLVGQSINLYDSAILGCYIHGLAGEISGKNKYSVKATDLIEYIPKVMKDIISD